MLGQNEFKSNASARCENHGLHWPEATAPKLETEASKGAVPADFGYLATGSEVRGSVVPERYASLHFLFAHGALRLRADADTDELMIDLERVDEADVEDLGQSAEFAPALGKILEYAWWMTNQRGYSDAFQIRFLDQGDRAQVTRQFEAAASAIRVSNVC